MEKRKLGDTDLQLTVIGLGTWAIGGDWAMVHAIRQFATSLKIAGRFTLIRLDLKRSEDKLSRLIC